MRVVFDKYLEDRIRVRFSKRKRQDKKFAKQEKNYRYKYKKEAYVLNGVLYIHPGFWKEILDKGIIKRGDFDGLSIDNKISKGLYEFGPTVEYVKPERSVSFSYYNNFAPSAYKSPIFIGTCY